MAKTDDLSSLSDAQLIDAYVENIQAFEKTEHVGAKNRIMDRRKEILGAIRARAGDSIEPLRVLLDHPDWNVRHCAAIQFRTVDHDAFERVVRPMAARDDATGRDAQSSLRLDAHFQQFGYPELQPPPAPRRIPELHWQSENPPPPAMAREEIERRLRDEFPTAIANAIVRLAAPAIGLWPQRPRGLLPVHASRLGGMPNAPPGWSWPTVGEEPMLFLGQIDCAALQGLPGAAALPAAGVLSFFGDHDAVTGCSGPGGDAAVFHWPDIDRLEPAEPPVEVTARFPLCALCFRPVVDLPDSYSAAIAGILADQDQISRYAELRDAVRHHGIPADLVWHCGFGKLLGWPGLVQQYDLDALLHGGGDLRLLLQLDQYSNGEEMEGWGPGGSLYFLIGGKDLHRHRFDRCEFEGQFT